MPPAADDVEASVRFLPRSYVEAFVDPEEKVDGDPAVWVHRAAFGVFRAMPVQSRSDGSPADLRARS
jgi:hypothetical protein